MQQKNTAIKGDRWLVARTNTVGPIPHPLMYGLRNGVSRILEQAWHAD